MSFAQGRDDESERVATIRNDGINAMDLWTTIYMQGNQTAMQCAAGKAMYVAVQQAEVPSPPQLPPPPQPVRRPRQLAE